MSWQKFENQAPDLALKGFQKLNRKIAYLATLKQDGSPRLHPVTPFIGNGILFIFTEPSSPKIRDLRRDGRYALHCSVDRKEGEPLTEFLVTGSARVVIDPTLSAQAAFLADSPVLTDDYIMFNFQVQRALWIEYDQAGKRTVHQWIADQP